MSHRATTDQEFSEWLDHPVTKAYRSMLKKWKEELKEEWASGSFTDMSQFGTAILNAKAIGQCELLDRLHDTEVNDINGEAK